MLNIIESNSIKFMKKGKPKEALNIRLESSLPSMHFLITGGSGFIGSNLARALNALGHRITILSRNPNKARKEFIEPIQCVKRIEANKSYDVIINLAGESITNGRWTQAKKKALYESRLNITNEILNYVKLTDNKPKLLLSGSAIGIYGTSLEKTFTEHSTIENGSMAQDLCIQWENAARQIEELGVRTCYLRTGLVLGYGGILSKLFLPFKIGLGGKLGQGNQWMSWIHIQDWLNIVGLLISDISLSGPINLTAPNPVTNSEFTSTLGQTLNRFTIFNVPSVLLKLGLGEMADEILLKGQKVLPEKMLNKGFKFKFITLNHALENILNKT